ncbi:DMT family transporter [Vibrio sp. HN007]|uniref:DMT family transporter n=1 Tax=Vibrio iocasae TaxID=3098914 RepID=UPI0035D4AA3A
MASAVLEKITRNKAVWVSVILLALPPLFWAGNFIVGRSVRGEIPPVSLSFYRWLIAAIILLPFTYQKIKKDWQLYLQSKYLVFISAISGVSAFNTLVYLGLQSTSANNGMILNAFIPLLISVIGTVLFGLRLTTKQWVGVAISLTGVITVITQGEPLSLLSFTFNPGDLTVIAAMFCWAIYTLVLKRLPAEIDRVGLIAVQVLIGLFALLPFYIMETASGIATQWNQHVIFSLVYVGLVPSVLAYLIYSACVERLGPTKAGLSTNLLPVFGILLSALFLGESLYMYQFVGMFMIFIGISLS